VKLRISQLLCIALLAGALVILSDGYAETEQGLASYYGAELAGQPTAGGEPFDSHGFTAAHRTLPLGTKLWVSYGGRSVQVTVNDRGPYTGGRELDLSQGAAEYLGLTQAGVDCVDYTVAGYGTGCYSSEADYASRSGGAGYYPDTRTCRRSLRGAGGRHPVGHSCPAGNRGRGSGGDKRHRRPGPRVRRPDAPLLTPRRYTADPPIAANPSQ